MFHVFTGFLSFTVIVCLQKSFPELFWLVLLDKICWISSSQIYSSILCLGKGTKNWLKHKIDLKQQHHRDITPCSFYVSMWTGSLFGERVQKSQEEGRERARACRQTSGTVVPWHPPGIRSWCKLLLARTPTIDRFDVLRCISEIWKWRIQIFAGLRLTLQESCWYREQKRFLHYWDLAPFWCKFCDTKIIVLFCQQTYMAAQSAEYGRCTHEIA